jgi:hypothetical protein
MKHLASQNRVYIIFLADFCAFCLTGVGESGAFHCVLEILDSGSPKSRLLSPWSSECFWTHTFWATVDSNLPSFASARVSTCAEPSEHTFFSCSVSCVKFFELLFHLLFYCISYLLNCHFFDQYKWFSLPLLHFRRCTLRTVAQILADPQHLSGHT